MLRCIVLLNGRWLMWSISSLVLIVGLVKSTYCINQYSCNQVCHYSIVNCYVFVIHTHLQGSFLVAWWSSFRLVWDAFTVNRQTKWFCKIWNSCCCFHHELKYIINKELKEAAGKAWKIILCWFMSHLYSVEEISNSKLKVMFKYFILLYAWLTSNACV